jgi:hypothetical protein
VRLLERDDPSFLDDGPHARRLRDLACV